MKMFITSHSRSFGYPSEFGRSSQLSFEGTDSNGSTVSLEFDNRYKDIVSTEFANVAGEVFEVEISIKRMELKTVYKS
jgi:hypothetical protein